MTEVLKTMCKRIPRVLTMSGCVSLISISLILPTIGQTQNFTPPLPPTIPVIDTKQNTDDQLNAHPTRLTRPVSTAQDLTSSETTQSTSQPATKQNKQPINLEQIQREQNQLTMLKTIYDTPLDRLEEICAQRTSAEIQQIKSGEYIRRETARNIMNSQPLSQTQKNQIADFIKSEEDFDSKLETIRQKKLKAENRANTKRAVLGYLGRVGRGMNNTFANAPAMLPMQPMPLMQPLTPMAMPMPSMSHVVINGQGGTIMNNPGMNGLGGTTYAFGPAFSNY